MARTARSLAVLSALVLALAPAVAQARFGKASDSQPTEKKEQSGDSHGGRERRTEHAATPVSAGGNGESREFHAATPVGVSPVVISGSDCSTSPDGCCWRHGGAWPAYFQEPRVYGGVGYSRGSGSEVRDEPGPRLRAELTAELLQLYTLDGGIGAGQLRVEGLGWGVALKGQQIWVAAEDGSGSVDRLSFLDGFITYALLGSERGRLRLEAGVQTAFAPDLIVMSPAVGLSFALGIGDQFGMEATARASWFPHTQMEVLGGFSYALGPLGVRFGWRQIYLNDNGLVDGIAHSDRFSGPYVGAGMAF